MRLRPAQSGWSSLTAAGQTVASLVAEGPSNPQIGQRGGVTGLLSGGTGIIES